MLTKKVPRAETTPSTPAINHTQGLFLALVFLRDLDDQRSMVHMGISKSDGSPRGKRKKTAVLTVNRCTQTVSLEEFWKIFEVDAMALSERIDLLVDVQKDFSSMRHRNQEINLQTKNFNRELLFKNRVKIYAFGINYAFGAGHVFVNYDFEIYVG